MEAGSEFLTPLCLQQLTLAKGLVKEGRGCKTNAAHLLREGGVGDTKGGLGIPFLSRHSPWHPSSCSKRAQRLDRSSGRTLRQQGASIDSRRHESKTPEASNALHALSAHALEASDSPIAHGIANLMKKVRVRGGFKVLNNSSKPKAISYWKRVQASGALLQVIFHVQSRGSLQVSVYMEPRFSPGDCREWASFQKLVAAMEREDREIISSQLSFIHLHSGADLRRLPSIRLAACVPPEGLARKRLVQLQRGNGSPLRTIR